MPRPGEDCILEPARQVRRSLACLLVAAQLAGCATGERQELSARPEPESQRSAAGTIASYAGGGALLGTALTAEMMSDCQGDGCAFALLLGLFLIPIGAVIGAGVGVLEVVLQEEEGEGDPAAGGEEGCSDPQAAEWLRACAKDQGPPPPALVPSPDRGQAQPNAQFQSWLDGCGVSMERQLDVRRRTLVPAACRSRPVASWAQVQCLEREAAAEEEARRARSIFAAERARVRANPALLSCSPS